MSTSVMVSSISSKIMGSTTRLYKPRQAIGPNTAERAPPWKNAVAACLLLLDERNGLTLYLYRRKRQSLAHVTAPKHLGNEPENWNSESNSVAVPDSPRQLHTHIDSLYFKYPIFAFQRPPEMDGAHPTHRVAVVGGGPSGLILALGLARFARQVRLSFPCADLTYGNE